MTGTGNNVGGLVGYFDGRFGGVQSSYATGAVIGVDYVGGLIGNGYSLNVTSGSSTGSVSGRDSVGGLIGYMSIGTISNSHHTQGAVMGRSNVGGLIGNADYYEVTVSSSFATSPVTGTGSNVGGLIGYYYGIYGQLDTSYATGDVIGVNQVGGLVGNAYSASISKNYASGNVSGSSYVGGLVGLHQYGGQGPNYALGNVSGSSYVGGLTGGVYSISVYSSYSSGHVNGADAATTGGIIGYTSGTGFSSSYWDTQTSGQSAAIGNTGGGAVGLTTAQLKGVAPLPGGVTFNLGADFSGGAAGTPTGIYPYLVFFGPPIPTLITLTFTSHSANKVYGNTIDLTGLYDVTASSGAVPSLTGTLLLSSTGADPTAGVASYAVNVAQGSLVVPSGYEFQFISSGILSVTQRPITVTADAKTKVYGNIDPSLTFITSSLGSGVAVSGSLTRVVGENVGAYAIQQGTVDSASNLNYLITYVGANLTIGQRPITVTADAKTKVYGNIDPSLTFITSSLGSGVAVSGSLTRVVGENVGAYAIQQGTVDSASNLNYLITYVGANLTIGQRPITVTADAKTKVYGNIDPSLTFITSSLGSGVAVSGSLTRVVGENVGAYAIQQGTVDNASNLNYLITYVGANFAITRAPLTITALDARKTFGLVTLFSGAEFVTSALVGSDAVTSVTLTSPGAAFSAPIGLYAINAAAANGVGLNNYSITYVPGTLVVAPAPNDLFPQPTYPTLHGLGFRTVRAGPMVHIWSAHLCANRHCYSAPTEG